MRKTTDTTTAEPLRFWTRGAAEAVGLKSQTLRKYRSIGGGPVYRKQGTRCYYLRSDLERWLADRRAFRSTADERVQKRSEPATAATATGSENEEARVEHSPCAKCNSPRCRP